MSLLIELFRVQSQSRLHFFNFREPGLKIVLVDLVPEKTNKQTSRRRRRGRLFESWYIYIIRAIRLQVYEHGLFVGDRLHRFLHLNLVAFHLQPFGLALCRLAPAGMGRDDAVQAAGLIELGKVYGPALATGPQTSDAS